MPSRLLTRYLFRTSFGSSVCFAYFEFTGIIDFHTETFGHSKHISSPEQVGIDKMSTIVQTQATHPSNPYEARIQLTNRLGLLIGKGQYQEFAYSKLLCRYLNLPPQVQETKHIRAFSRQLCRRELASGGQSHSKVQMLFTALRQASQPISALLANWDLDGAEQGLKLAEADLEKLEQLMGDLQLVLMEHDSLLGDMFVLREQLMAFEGAVDGLEDRYEALEARARKINPLLGAELVSAYSLELCYEGFDFDMDPEVDETRYQFQMGILDDLLQATEDAIEACDSRKVHRVLLECELGIEQMQIYLSELEAAVVEYEMANMMTPYYFSYFEKDEDEHQMCSSPVSFDSADEVGFATACEELLKQARKAQQAKAGFTLKDKAARSLDDNDILTHIRPFGGPNELSYKDFDFLDNLLDA